MQSEGSELLGSLMTVGKMSYESNIKSIRMGQCLEFSFRVQLKRQEQCRQLINDLSGLEGIERVSMIFNGYEEDVTV